MAKFPNLSNYWNYFFNTKNDWTSWDAAYQLPYMAGVNK